MLRRKLRCSASSDVFGSLDLLRLIANVFDHAFPFLPLSPSLCLPLSRTFCVLLPLSTLRPPSIPLSPSPTSPSSSLFPDSAVAHVGLSLTTLHFISPTPCLSVFPTPSLSLSLTLSLPLCRGPCRFAHPINARQCSAPRRASTPLEGPAGFSSRNQRPSPPPPRHRAVAVDGDRDRWAG